MYLRKTFLTMNLLRMSVILYLMLSNADSLNLNSKGEYEDLVINIDPKVKDLTFLKGAKVVMKSFSRILYFKTQKRFSIKSVIVVLPPDYDEETLGNETTTDLFDEALPKKASILVVPSNNSHHGPPLKTVHLGGCGQPGEYIQISNEVFGNAATVYGTTNDLLLHEWAHYRWGLFDEYGVSGEDMDSPFYLTANKKIKPTACPGTLKGWMLTGDLKRCGRNDNLLPQPGCQFHLYFNESDIQLSSLLMGYAKNKHDEFCGSEKIQHNPSSPSLHNLKCQHKSALDVLANHPDFMKISENVSKDLMEKIKYTFLKRNTLTNKKFIVILYNQFKDTKAPSKIKAALNLVQKYEVLSNFTLQYEDTDNNNLTTVLENYSSKNAKNFDKSNSIWVVTDERKLTGRFGNYYGVNFLVLANKITTTVEEDISLSLGDGVTKNISEKSSVTEIFNFFIEYVVKRILPDDKVPELIYKHLFAKGNVTGSFMLDSNCSEALFIASEVNNSNRTTMTGRLLGPKGECSTSRQRDLSSPSCSDATSDSILAFKISDENFTRGKWRYEINAVSYDSISVNVLCRLRSKLFQVIPRLFTKNLEASGIYNASLKNNIAVLAASVMYDEKPVLHASVYVDVDSEHTMEEWETPIQLYDDGLGSDMFKNDGIYTIEFLNFKGNGHYSFSFRVNINGSSEVLEHHQFLKMDDKNIPVVVELGRNMNFPSFVLRNISTIEWVLKEYGDPKDEFSYEDLSDPYKLDMGYSTENAHFDEETQRTSEALSLEVIQYSGDLFDVIDPGQVTDLKVTNKSYIESHVSLEWTSVGDDGLFGTARKIDLKFTKDGSAFPSQFQDPGISTNVNETHLMEGSSLQPLQARRKHSVTIKVPKKEGALFQEDEIFFFALAYSDEADNIGLVSNVAYSFFKPEKYSDEIKEIRQQHKSGVLIIVIFFFFIAALGVFICAIKWYHKHQRQIGISPEQFVKYNK